MVSSSSSTDNTVVTQVGTLTYDHHILIWCLRFSNMVFSHRKTEPTLSAKDRQGKQRETIANTSTLITLPHISLDPSGWVGEVENLHTVGKTSFLALVKAFLFLCSCSISICYSVF